MALPASTEEILWLRTDQGVGPHYEEWLDARRDELVRNPMGVRAPDVIIARCRVGDGERFVYETMSSAPYRSLAALEAHARSTAESGGTPGKLVSLDYHSASTDARGDVVVTVTPKLFRRPATALRLYLPVGFRNVSAEARTAIEATLGDDACERELEIALQRGDGDTLARLQEEAHRRSLSTMRMGRRLAARGFRDLALRGIRHHLSLLPDDEEAKAALAEFTSG